MPQLSSALQPGTRAQLSASVTHHSVQEEMMHLPCCANGLAMQPLWMTGQERMPHAQQPAAFQNSP